MPKRTHRHIEQGSLYHIRQVVIENYRDGYYDDKWWDGTMLKPIIKTKRSTTARFPIITDREDGRYVYFFRVWEPGTYVDGDRYYKNLAMITDEYQRVTNTRPLEFKTSRKGRRVKHARNSD